MTIFLMKLNNSFLLIFLFVQIGNALDFQVKDGKITLPKYEYNGKPVWDDSQKDRLIAGSVSSSTVKDSDFIDYETTLTLSEQEIISELSTERLTHTEAQKEISRRSGKKFNLDVVIELKKEQAALISIGKEKSFDVSADTSTIQIEIDKAFQRYQTAVK